MWYLRFFSPLIMAELFETPRFIAIEGPIRVGKSTLARILAEKLQALRIVEPENNPFLDRFYQELSGMALATQMWFLVERYDQMRQAAKELAGSEPPPMVADYLFEKDKLFAYINFTRCGTGTLQPLLPDLSQRGTHTRPGDLFARITGRTEAASAAQGDKPGASHQRRLYRAGGEGIRALLLPLHGQRSAGSRHIGDRLRQPPPGSGAAAQAALRTDQGQAILYAPSDPGKRRLNPPAHALYSWWRIGRHRVRGQG